MAISKKIRRTGNTSGSAHDPKLKLDLKDVFDKFPKRGDSLKEAIGGAVVDRIRERAKNEEFVEASRGAKKYSDSYANSFDFKVFGKTKDNVNMTQSGFMLDDMDLAESKGSNIAIEFGELINKKKAHGHITGNVGKKRDFFGLTDSDLNQIKKQFAPQVNRAVAAENKSTLLPQRRSGESLITFLKRAIGSVNDDG